jgi:hypothetical protein
MLFMPSPGTAQTLSSPGTENAVTADVTLQEMLRMVPLEVIHHIGVPSEVYPLRGETPEEDLVVFYYDDYLYVFFYENRAIQFRIDHRSERTFLGLKMGMDVTEIILLLGNPMKTLNGSLVYSLRDQGFPVRLRLFIEDDRLKDLYLYRGDY